MRNPPANGLPGRTPVGVGQGLNGPRTRLWEWIGVATLLSLGGFAPVSAQTAVQNGAVQNSVVIVRADSLFARGESKAALILLRDRLAARDSTGYALLWRAARAAIAQGSILPGPYPQNYLLEEGMRWGALAEAEAVAGPLGLNGERLPTGSTADVSGGYWQLASTGLRAKNAAPRYGAELADQIWTGGYALLARAPDDPRVHSLLGRLHMEIMSLSWTERVLGRLIVGGEVLGNATWDDAEMHLTRAVELEPSSPRYLLDLALLHAARERPTAARLLAERVLGLRSDAVDAEAVKQAASDLIDRLGG